MNKIKIITSIFLLPAAVILLNGCKKPDPLNGIKDSPVIYAVQANQQTDPITVQMVSGKQSFIFSAGYGGLRTPQAPVNVAFTLDTGSLSAYNQALSESGTKTYLPLPASNYSFSSLSGTIPAGGVRTEPLYLNVNAIGLNSTGKYALALTLSAANGGYSINPQVKTIIFLIDGLNNIYAGAYSARGVRTNYYADGTVSSNPATFNFIKNLTTVSADTSAIDAVANLGANRSNTVFEVAVDAGNKVNISGYIDNPANPIINEPGTTSTYDPVAKTFYLSYRYTLTTNGGIYRVMTDTLTKQ